MWGRIPIYWFSSAKVKRGLEIILQLPLHESMNLICKEVEPCSAKYPINLILPPLHSCCISLHPFPTEVMGVGLIDTLSSVLGVACF